MPRGQRKEAPKNLSVIERRLQNPLSRRSREIPLGEHMKGWTTRFFTQDVSRPDRHYEAVHELGYTPCTAEDFGVDPKTLGLNLTPEGYVCRGSQSQDILMRIPTKDYRAIQKRKSEENLKGVGKGKLQSEVAQAAAKVHGDEAGDTVYKHYEQRDVVERVSSGMGE